ncbi:MAG: hypothetical protein ACLQJR_10650 [Stellaceae bacterium]
MPDITKKAIYLDTIGKLHERGYGMFGWCDDCAALYRKDLPAKLRTPAAFDIDLAILIAERGRDHPVTTMTPVPCPRCTSRRTSIRIISLPKH